VRVLLFARLRELVGRDALEMEVPDGTTLGGVWAALQQSTPALRAFRLPPLMACDQEYAAPETVPREGAEVAFLPPVSGG
jgi:molybdopterin converting factor subunit 1